MIEQGARRTECNATVLHSAFFLQNFNLFYYGGNT